MGITEVLVFIMGAMLAGMGASLYWMLRMHRYSVECANIMLQHESNLNAQVIEAEERGRWNEYDAFKRARDAFAPVETVVNTEIPNFTQELEPPADLLMAYGVTRVQDLPAPLRAVWDKDYQGGDN